MDSLPDSKFIDAPLVLRFRFPLPSSFISELPPSWTIFKSSEEPSSILKLSASFKLPPVRLTPLLKVDKFVAVIVPAVSVVVATLVIVAESPVALSKFIFSVEKWSMSALSTFNLVIVAESRVACEPVN